MSDKLTGTYSMRAALLAQLGGILAIALLTFTLGRYSTASLQPVVLLLAMLQGGIAALIAFRQGAPRWWLFIHMGFCPLAVFVHQLDIPSHWFLAGFLLLLLIFWRTDQSRVPLYLSNRLTADAVFKLLPDHPVQIIDIGCGDGGFLARLAKARQDCQFTGVEHAPLPWLLARIRTMPLGNVQVKFGNLWELSLRPYQVVYAFLSPAPMARLASKVHTELEPDALLISNSFAIPGQAITQTIDVNDRRGTRLYCYRQHLG